MSKVLDWSKVADTMGFDDKRRAAHGQTTFRQLMEDAYKKEAENRERQELVKSQEPFLRNELLKHMVNRIPIHVLSPIPNWTEAIAGSTQGQDELDSFYYNGASSGDLAKSTENARFEVTQEIIPSGIDLVFKSWNKTLGQWAFIGSNGKEYAIYDSDTIMIGPNRSAKNTGLYGLLFNTSLTQKLGEE